MDIFIQRCLSPCTMARSSASSVREDPERASSTDLTGEEQGREPASQDIGDSNGSGSGVATASEATTVPSSVSSVRPEVITAVPVDAALEVEELDADMFRSKVSGEQGVGALRTEVDGSDPCLHRLVPLATSSSTRCIRRSSNRNGRRVGGSNDPRGDDAALSPLLLPPGGQPHKTDHLQSDKSERWRIVLHSTSTRAAEW